MVKVMYSFLLVGISAGVGLCGVLFFLNWKLYRLTPDKRRKSLGTIIAGTGLQDAILTWALIDAGTTQLNIRSYLYAFALIISTVGLAWKCGQFGTDLALKESVLSGDASWLNNLERRLVAEEARNTTIEKRAAKLTERVADEEDRGKATEDHA